MKKLILVFAVILFTMQTNAQEKKSSSEGILFTKGTKVAQVGIGLGSAFGLPIGASVEFGITDKIGVGGYIGYASKSYSILTNEYKVTSLLVGARGQYHFYNTDKIDAYGGAMLGYNAASAKWSNNFTGAIPVSYGGLAYAGFVGGRYYFTDNIAAFAELGYGIGYLTVGVAMKF